MKKYTNSFTSYIKAHKFLSTIAGIIVLIIIIVAYRKTHTVSAETRYVLGTAQKGTLITTVTGTGQIASTNQIDIKPKVSGDVTYVGVNAGQTVKAGDDIARIDSTDAQKALRNAELDLTAAKIAYEKSIQSSQNNISTSNDTLSKAYIDGFSAMGNAFNSLPVMLTTMNDILYNQNHSPYLTNQNLSSFGSSNVDYKNTAGKEFDTAKNEYQKNFDDFKAITPSSDPQAIYAVISETYQTTQDLLSSQKDLNNLINLVISNSKPVTSQMTTDQTAVSGDITKNAGFVSDLYNAKNTIDTANRTLSQQTSTLNGSDNLDIESAKLALAQKQSAVVDAEQTLSYYTVRAPFDGVIGKVSAQVAGSASSGTALASIITKQSIAIIALNEIDIAKVKVGQKVNITFDAIPDLTLTGEVAQVDQIGTVTQGVVSYNVQISFDTQDDRIKPGMSMSASIITDAKPDVLLVPTSAIKTTGNTTIVQVVTNVASSTDSSTNSQTGVVLKTPPQTVVVQVGSANDTDTEIISGINEGETIVTKTITGTTAKTTTSTTQRSATSLLGGGTGGGATRALR